MTEEIIIPPKEEWVNLSVTQLYDVKAKLQDRYYEMRRVNASFANQYLSFSDLIDVLIQRQERIKAEEARQ